MDTPINGTDERIFGYESDASASFLVITGTDRASEYQCSMLGLNAITHLIPPERMVKDSKTYFYYNITSKVPLSVYLKRKKFSRQEFLKFIFDIASSVNDAYGYLLNSSNFVFMQDHIYICPDTLEPFLVYVPAARGGESCEALKSFVSELLLQHIQAEGFDSGNIVQRLLCAVKSEAFNLKGFVRLISELLYGENGESLTNTAMPDEAGKQGTAFYDEAAAGGDKNAGRPDAGLKARVRAEPKAGVKAEPKAGPKAGLKTGAKAETKAWSKTGAKAETKAGSNETPQRRPARLFVIFAILLQFIIALAIYLCRGLIDSAGDNHTANYAAVLMIAAAVDVLIFKKILTSGMIGLKTKNTEVGEGERGPKGEVVLETSMATIPGPEVYKPEVVKPGIPKPGMSRARIPEPGMSRASVPEPGMSKARVPEPGMCRASVPEPGMSRARIPESGIPEPEAIKPDNGSLANDRPDVPTLSNKTELLGRHAKGVRVLKSTGKRAEEGDIVLDKDDFIIGRLEEHVDHVLYNNAVGKLHAELINRNGISYVKDLNSMNGTFINDSRIESNKEYELRTNDRLRLANSEYIFTYSC